MLEFFITCLIMSIDILLLLFMVPFHFYIGIPIFIKPIDMTPNTTIEDIGFDMSENIVYKISQDKLIFRSQFTYSTMYGLKILSIIKGDIRISGDKARITPG